MLDSWSLGPPVADTRPVTERFAEHVRRQPDAVAVSDAGGSLSYGELARRAAAVAAELTRQGIGRESVVAVCTGRSTHLVVGELAAALAGAAFQPMDPAHPAVRLGELLGQSGAAALLTHDDAGRRPAAVRRAGAAARRRRVAGSRPGTGRRRARWCGACYHGPPGRAGLRHLHLGIDGPAEGHPGHRRRPGQPGRLAWPRNTAWPPVTGRRSSPARPSTPRSGRSGPRWPAAAPSSCRPMTPAWIPRELARWITAERLTWIVAARGADRRRARRGAGRASAALAQLFTGGEAVRRTTPDGLPFSVINAYGPTETTVICTATALPPGGPARPPIGWPMGGQRVYVLDGLDPVPAGVPGEVCVGGAQVSRGYLGDAAATAAAFVPDPWTPGQRMYRTGDRARWLPDGRLDFLGRTDEQVKIRGFRIEPGEIAAALRQHPQVADAVVLARPDAAGRTRLAGYAETSASAEELRAFLAARLPGYLIPDRLIPLAALPQTTSGKLDAAALPAPSRRQRSPGPGQHRRRTADRRAVAGPARGRAVGADDDFFGLGGYSLLVTTMLAQVEGSPRPYGAALGVPGRADAGRAGQRPRRCRDLRAGCRRPGRVRPRPRRPGQCDIADDLLSEAEAAALLSVLADGGEGG